MMNYLSEIVGIGMTVLLIIMLQPLAIRLGLVDTPGGRKLHEGQVPLVGGIAMFGGFCFALLTLNISLVEYRSLLAASLVLICVGVLDDFKELNARKKLIAQIFAALLITVWGQTQLKNLGDLFFLGDLQMGYFSIPLTVFAMIGLINAVNMIDGLDGLAGAISFVQLSLFYYLASRSHLYFDANFLLILMAVLLAFLWFNFPYMPKRENKIFMGDAGSMFLGLVLVWFAINLTQGPIAEVRPVTMLWIMAVPLMDTLAAIIRRVRKGRSPFHADRAHFHHVFLQAGYSNLQTVLCISVFSLLIGILGIIGDVNQIPEGVMFFGFIGLFALYLYAVSHAWKVSKTLKRKKHL